MHAYWAQWSRSELMSMQGVDMDNLDAIFRQDDCDADLCQDEPEEGCCSDCMDCLGLSWRDFL
jgi:hypothetical protein